MKRKITAIILVVALVLALAIPMAAVGASNGSIVALWHFDEGTGTTAFDSAGSNDGTINGASWTTSGMFDKALSFDGSDDYVDCGNNTSLDVTTAITIEAWVKAPSAGQTNGDALVWKKGAYLIQYWNNRVNAGVYTTADGWGGSSWLSTKTIFDNTWHHVALTYDGSTMLLYIDGALDTSKTLTTGGNIVTNANDLYFGCRTPTTYLFNGAIDEVRIWDEALSASQLGDVSAPVVTITAPTDGACYQIAPAGAYAVVDANSYTVEETGYSTDEGVHTYTVTATDVLGYVGSASVTYTVDDTAPVVTITAPADGGFYPVGTVPAGAYTIVELNPDTVVEAGWSDGVGMHTYTVNATDCAGNVGSDSVTYYVLQKYVSGGGQLIEETDGKRKDWLVISFGGAVGDAGTSGLVGEWEVNFHNVNTDGMDKTKFHTTSIDVMNFFERSCGIAMNFTAIGEWQGIPGYKMTFRAQDAGEPGRQDNVRIELFDPEGNTVYDTNWSHEFTAESDCVGTSRTPLDHGNLQMDDLS